MRTCLFSTGLGLLLVLAIPGSAPASTANQPNIVFFLVDDLGYMDIGANNPAAFYETPNVDALARSGQRFTSAYAACPVCSPTRAAILTGKYPQRTGITDYIGAAQPEKWNRPTKLLPAPYREKLALEEVTLAEAFKASGYQTFFAGKWHLGYTPNRAPNAHGFDHFFGLLSGNHDYFTHRENNGEPDLYLDQKPVVMEGYSTHLITRHALQFLDAMKDKPFFL